MPPFHGWPGINGQNVYGFFRLRHLMPLIAYIQTSVSITKLLVGAQPARARQFCTKGPVSNTMEGEALYFPPPPFAPKSSSSDGRPFCTADENVTDARICNRCVVAKPCKTANYSNIQPPSGQLSLKKLTITQIYFPGFENPESCMINSNTTNKVIDPEGMT